LLHRALHLYAFITNHFVLLLLHSNRCPTVAIKCRHDDRCECSHNTTRKRTCKNFLLHVHIHVKQWHVTIPWCEKLNLNNLIYLLVILLFFNRSTRSRKQKARHAAEEHRRQLQALLLNKNPSSGSVNGLNNDDDLHDDGTELLGAFDTIRVICHCCITWNISLLCSSYLFVWLMYVFASSRKCWWAGVWRSVKPPQHRSKTFQGDRRLLLLLKYTTCMWNKLHMESQVLKVNPFSSHQFSQNLISPNNINT